MSYLRWTTEEVAELVMAHRAGKTMTQLGAMKGVSRERIRLILKRVKVTGRDGGVARKLDSIVERLDPNKTATENAIELGLDRARTHSIAKLRGVTLQKERDSETIHGTIKAYQSRKCRCDLCRKANADKAKAYLDTRYPGRRRYRDREVS